VPEINWIEGQPSNDSLVVKAPRFLRETWRATSLGLAESLFWPGSGGGSNVSQGELKPGASKAFFAAASASSSAASESHRGKLFMSSDESRLLVYDSAYTAIAGTPFLIEHETYFEDAQWVEHFGSYVTNTGGGVIGGTVTLTGTSYAGVPLVILMSDNTTHDFQITSLTAADFLSNVSGPTGNQTYRWVSLGTENT